MAESIDDYRGKRDFGRTSEPLPSRSSKRSGPPVFVVHRHEARRLHYDLRLEMDGVLKSWAVPKGFSYDPKEKKLAIQTEDHPIEYEHFHGVIPREQYGAGMMTIWDRGHYSLDKEDGLTAIQDGKIELQLSGGRLRGEWHMVRLKSAKEWLMFKARDCYARTKEEPVFSIDWSLPRSGFPRRTRFMAPSQYREAFSQPDWIFELKFSGLRVWAEKRQDEIRLRDDKGKNYAEQFPEIAKDLAKVRATNVVFDGVIVCLDEKQRPNNDKLQDRIAGRSKLAACLYVYDVTYFDEWSLRSLPLTERKAALASLLPELRHLCFVEHEWGRGVELAKTIRKAGLRGMIAKEASSLYRAGTSDAWIELSTDPEGSQKLPVAEALRAQTAKSPGIHVPFTNRNKILWPQDGFTKGDLIDYYSAVADALVPYLKGRPLSLNRYPNGILNESFYQKNTPEHVPDWIETVAVETSRREEPIHFVVCNNRPTLLFLANLASIDLHPWLSRYETVHSPDWAVIDLDPSQDNFEDVITLARAIGELLRDVGLRPYLKTSGAKGMHVYVPLIEGYTYDHSRMFCEGVARIIAKRYSDIATIERTPNQRDGKIYLDFLQNRRGQTVVAPYVVRPVHGASVSAPLLWDELVSGLRPSMFTIQTMPHRLKEYGDLFSPTLEDRQNLLPAIEAIHEMMQDQIQ